MMTRTIFSLLFLSFGISVSAQIGITAAGSTIRATDWQRTFQEEYNTDNALFLTGYDVGLNYWFRLKNKRVEFFPTIARSEYNTYFDPTGRATAPQDELIAFGTSFTGFHFDTRIYPFDFASDCDCPVWSKQNDVLKKGFYLMLSPGVDYVEVSQQEVVTSDWLFTVSGGIGLDLGISDLLTVTPFVNIRYTPEVDGDVLFPNEALGNDFDDVIRLIGGLAINLRFDGDKY